MTPDTDLSRRRCILRMSNGQDHDACDEPAVLIDPSGYPICRSCAEQRLETLTRKLKAVHEALK